MDRRLEFLERNRTSRQRELQCAYGTRCRLVLLLYAAIFLPVTTGIAASFSPERERGASGIAVFDAICAECHLGGEHGAPRVGDRAAWSKRLKKGTVALASYAQNGTCSTEPQDIAANANVLELQRAVVYMVNNSGGNLVAPDASGRPAGKRDAVEIVQSYCAVCHAAGVSGAPRIGDRQAWTKRLSNGIDKVVRSAIQGNHGMPPRGGADGLTDAEVTSAITYMARSTQAEALRLKTKSRPERPGEAR